MQPDSISILIIGTIVVAWAILLIALPFIVFKIRNQVIIQTQLLTEIRNAMIGDTAKDDNVTWLTDGALNPQDHPKTVRTGLR